MGGDIISEIVVCNITELVWVCVCCLFSHEMRGVGPVVEVNADALSCLGAERAPLTGAHFSMLAAFIDCLEAIQLRINTTRLPSLPQPHPPFLSSVIRNTSYLLAPTYYNSTTTATEHPPSWSAFPLAPSIQRVNRC